jgi:ribosomal protein S11
MKSSPGNLTIFQMAEFQAKEAPADKEIANGETYVSQRKREKCLAIGHTSATCNDSIPHVTDFSGAETLCKVVKAHTEILAAQQVVARLKNLGIDGLHVKLCDACPGGDADGQDRVRDFASAPEGWICCLENIDLHHFARSASELKNATGEVSLRQ